MKVKHGRSRVSFTPAALPTVVSHRCQITRSDVCSNATAPVKSPSRGLRYTGSRARWAS